jgi:hypothetical protein
MTTVQFIFACGRDKKQAAMACGGTALLHRSLREAQRRGNLLPGPAHVQQGSSRRA